MPDIRQMEAESIRGFVLQAVVRGYLKGRVLDYGCGKQPYRDIVESAGLTYVGYDEARFPANVSGKDILEDVFDSGDFDSILCTQVVQYVWDVQAFLYMLRDQWLEKDGHLILTYPTNWPEVEADDLHRFTRTGMDYLMAVTGFTIVEHEWRAGFRYEGSSFALGYGVVARA